MFCTFCCYIRSFLSHTDKNLGASGLEGQGCITPFSKMCQDVHRSLLHQTIMNISEDLFVFLPLHSTPLHTPYIWQPSLHQILFSINCSLCPTYKRTQDNFSPFLQSIPTISPQKRKKFSTEKV